MLPNILKAKCVYWLLLCASVSTPGLLNAKPTSNYQSAEQLLQKEQQSWQNLVTVQATNFKQYTQIMISHHGELLDSNQQQLTVTLNLSDKQLQRLKATGLQVKANPSWRAQRQQQLAKRFALNKNTQAGIPGYSCYETVEETYQAAEDLAASYPTLASWIDIGDSWRKTQNQGGYDLRVLKLTNQATSGDKPKLFIHSAMHAREYATAPLNLAFARELLNEYNSDANATWLLDYQEVHLLFHMNPDGRKEAEQGVLWRKNANESYCANSNPGADLNRNFSFFWNATNGEGSSGYSCDSTYRGPSPASEPETQAVESYVRSLFADSRGEGMDDAAPLDTPGMHIDLHSYSELVLWPWGNTEEPAPNGTQLQTLGRKLAWFNDYYPTQSVGLYPTDGTSDEVSYGELGIANVTFELGTAFFQSCSAFNSSVKPDNLNALNYAARVTRAPYLLPSGPEVDNILANGKQRLSVAAGEQVTITAVADDGRFNQQNGSEPVHVVAGVKLYRNTPPWSEQATAISALASDDAFDETQEAITATLDTTDWSEGTHIVYLQAEDANGSQGAVNAVFIDISDNQNPIAAFDYNCDEVDCAFDASASNDDQQITDYQWTFSDGTQLEGVTVEHSFNGAGQYSVELSVVDDEGATDSQQQTISVTQNLNPVASFGYSCDKLSCSFDASESSDDQAVVDYHWTFSDGTELNGVEVEHTFATEGNYSVELSVADEQDATDTLEQSISVSENTAKPDSSSGGVTLFSLLLLMFGFLRRKV